MVRNPKIFYYDVTEEMFVVFFGQQTIERLSFPVSGLMYVHDRFYHRGGIYLSINDVMIAMKVSFEVHVHGFSPLFTTYQVESCNSIFNLSVFAITHR